MFARPLSTDPTPSVGVVGEVAQLLSALATLAWPVLAAALFLCFRKSIVEVVRTWAWRKTTIKVAGTEVSFDSYNAQSRELIADLQEKVIALSSRDSETSEKSVRGVATLLWVDDHPQNHVVLVEQLEQRGISVVRVETSSEAMAAIEEASFDVVITDMHRKENDGVHNRAGIELVRALREQGITVPVAMYFGRSRRSAEHFRKEAMEAGIQLVTSSATELLKFIGGYPTSAS